MPKPQYTQKFRHEWLQDPFLKDWLIAVESTGGLLPKCKMCHKILNSHYGLLKKHTESKKHQEMKKIIVGSTQPKIKEKVKENHDKKVAEAGLALFIANHTSINQIDHLSNLCKNVFKNCPAGFGLQIHRTKCTNIIKNVLSPFFKEDLRHDIGNSSFSILIDESTDISVKKFLGIVIIYFSQKSNRVVTTYLDMPTLSDFSATSIVETIKKVFREYKLNLNNLIGIGTDNASVMVGINNGVYAQLKTEIPHLILVRCVCHSVQLAVSSAAKNALPRNLEYLIRETYDWFARSTSKKEYYENLYKTLNDGQQPLKIVQSCQTRWLSIEPAVARIVNQWIELKLLFETARYNERCYTAEILYNLYKDDKNYIFMCFLKTILNDVHRVNKLFESNDVDPLKLLNELTLLIESLINKITTPRQKQIDIFNDNFLSYLDRNCYLGYLCENSIQTMKGEGKLSLEEEKLLRERMINFVVSLINELKQRLPENIAVLKMISNISVDKSLSHNRPSLVELLKHFSYNDEKIDKMLDSWNRIHLIKWNNTTETKTFWYEVISYKDAAGQNPFYDLAIFALKMLSLPHSNADVERLFSQLNLIKNKLRNRLEADTVKDIICIRAGLKRYNKCCFNFDLPKSIIDQIKTNETYKESAILNFDFNFIFEEDCS